MVEVSVIPGGACGGDVVVDAVLLRGNVLFGGNQPVRHPLLLPLEFWRGGSRRVGSALQGGICL